MNGDAAVADDSPEDGLRRRQLLEAAERCFLRSGFQGARMAAIAKEAGTSPGLIYHYFDSKEAIIAEMVAAHVADKRANLAALARVEGSIVDAFLDGLEQKILTGLGPFWSSLTLEVTAEATRNEEVARIIRAADEEVRSALIATVAAYVPAGEAEARTETFLALLQGLGLRRLINPDLPVERMCRSIRIATEALFGQPSGSLRT